ncbi:MAG: Crp/Fnr family transcriptional regulator, partial [Rubrivivax sp.]
QLLRAAEAQMLDELPCPPLVLRVGEGQPVQLEGTRAESIHVVRSGAFKCVRMLEDGYEQVLSFAERGDVLGYDGLCHGVHATTAIALEVSTVYVLPLGTLDALALQAPRLDRALRSAVSRELVDAWRMADMMAAVSSETRLARFVLWCADRAHERGESTRRLRLRMGRREIASFLAVAHETVSRCFTLLARQGVLRVDNREVEILDRAALVIASRGTRRCADDAALSGAAAAPG